MATHSPGSLVRYRRRGWVVLPPAAPDTVRLRPLAGSQSEILDVLNLSVGRPRPDLGWESIEPDEFPLPMADAVLDHAAVRLLLDAVRLLLRDGAAPFRCLGNLSVRPRPYQFVPMLMALRQDVVRLLIADDVGVGKTIEAGLVARELLDRRRADRLCVLCPPSLCDQWQRELAEKFHIEAAVVRTATIGRLEREKPHTDRSIFQHYQHLVCSIDLVKGERYRSAFVQHCPGLVILDEAHGAAESSSLSGGQKQRRDLALQLVKDERRHLVMLTATPHSGVDESFLSLLELLDPASRQLDLAALTEPERIGLARHFVQRTRGDVKRWLADGSDDAEGRTPFPERDPSDAPYAFSGPYDAFFKEVHAYAEGVVRSAETLTGFKRRMRFWSALALLHSVASSPAQAASALRSRASGADRPSDGTTTDAETAESVQMSFAATVFDSTDTEAVSDEGPDGLLQADAAASDTTDPERRRLRDLARRAEALCGEADHKLLALREKVAELLRAGRHVIVWCRYIATAEYVAEELRRRLGRAYKDLRVVAVTGRLSDEERRAQVESLADATSRVLVATDCLSEGVNLQQHFNAAVHYDLSWNPNRLEQREGRIDRFGQLAETVPIVMLYGTNNRVDGAVIEVLLRKAQRIHRALGVHVPVPLDDATVTEALVHSVFTGKAAAEVQQLSLFEEAPSENAAMRDLHDRWDRAANREQRERQTRTRFAQHGIHPDEVVRELHETDQVLGDPATAQAFLVRAAERIGFNVRRLPEDVLELRMAELPPAIQSRLPQAPAAWRITFTAPAPDGVTYVGRSHPLLEALAEHVFDLALNLPETDALPASRCGAIRSGQVSRLTRLLLLRFRFLLYEQDGSPSLAEETVVWGYTKVADDVAPLALDEALALLEQARAAAPDLAPLEKRERIEAALAEWPALHSALADLTRQRAARLMETHRRVRRLEQSASVRIEPAKDQRGQTALPDLLGVLVLVPAAPGARS